MEFNCCVNTTSHICEILNTQSCMCARPLCHHAKQYMDSIMIYSMGSSVAYHHIYIRKVCTCIHFQRHPKCIFSHPKSAIMSMWGGAGGLELKHTIQDP